MQTEYYPQFIVPPVQNPNRWYAIPLIGFLIKIIMLVPAFIVVWALMVVVGVFVILINPFFVLFTGKYWNRAYRISTDLLIYKTKIFLFLSGLMDQYPGFNDFNTNNFTLPIPQPTNPNRFFAIPLIGIVLRFLLMVPYFVYTGVLRYAAYLGIVIAFVSVLFEGEYQESFYELARDYLRVSLASSMYTFGLSDNYPSFKISMNHKKIKVLLIVLGAVILIAQVSNSANHNNNTSKNYPPYSTSRPY